MKDLSLNTPLTEVRKIDGKRSKALKKLGLVTLEDLLWYWPARWDDFSIITPIAKVTAGDEVTVAGNIQSISTRRTPRQGMTITEALISDASGSIKVVWFNQLYLATFLPKGTDALLHGRADYDSRGLKLSNPSYEKQKADPVHLGRIVPVYSATKNLTPKWLRFFIKPLLGNADKFKEFLPKKIIKKHQLVGLSEAIKQIHFPDSNKLLEAAKRRLAFDELLLLQINAQANKKKWVENLSYQIKFDESGIKKFVASLPFTLTKDQKKAAWEIFKDLDKGSPMNRLLEGDVGSGKTVVAVMAMQLAATQGFQSVLMAPTEILARQHFNAVGELLKDSKLKVGLLTRVDFKLANKDTPQKDLLKQISTGKVDVIIGTHALIQEKVGFKDLALAIVDEQHRFGVGQRAALKKINKNKKVPHLLSMTATPIPRTLALAIFGDLDLSIIREMPKGRKPILTKVVVPMNRTKAYGFIKKQITSGRQVFVVCPLIEESDKLGVKSVKQEYKKLDKDIFPDLAIGIMHGKLKKEEKETTMQDFFLNKIKILVSTSVVEVGIDVPNATVMMIEGAERFGLAQLHQFRGRVGRSEHQSYCFLFSDSDAENTLKRLSALVASNDGFYLAKRDLEIRGPGEVYGLRQSGFPDIQMASLMDTELLKLAREDAEELVKKNKLDDYPAIKNKLRKFSNVLHLE